jgi:hypothetical protein
MEIYGVVVPKALRSEFSRSVTQSLVHRIIVDEFVEKSFPRFGPWLTMNHSCVSSDSTPLGLLR